MRILIIGPPFFSYTSAIKEEVEKRSIFCLFHKELFSDAIIPKLFLRLGIGFFYGNKKQKHWEKIFKLAQDNNITDIIFISPKSINLSILERLSSIDKIKLHLYMWDSFSNQRNSLSLLSSFDTISSFDPVDCKNNNMSYIPLFSEAVYSSNTMKKKYDLSFCGTMHSKRPALVNKLSNFSDKHDLKLKLLLYYYSKWWLFIRLIMNLCCFNLLRYTSFSSFSKTEIAEVFSYSNAVVDFSHDDQNGLTSRTFEVLRTGSKLITTNKFARTLGHSLDERIFILNDLFSQDKELLQFLRKI